MLSYFQRIVCELKNIKLNYILCLRTGGTKLFREINLKKWAILMRVWRRRKIMKFWDQIIFSSSSSITFPWKNDLLCKWMLLAFGRISCEYNQIRIIRKLSKKHYGERFFSHEAVLENSSSQNLLLLIFSISS